MKGIVIMTLKTSNYWENRGRMAFRYKNETFYTITPVPYYQKRREILLQLMSPYLEADAIAKICDFGCGDGWYLEYFSRIFSTSNKSWHGVDISKTMIDCAKSKLPDQVVLHVSDKGIQHSDAFDLIYSITVFAHILDDKTIISLFNDIATKTKERGKLLCFEQTGPKRQTGFSYTRRQSSDYVKFAKMTGWKLEKKILIDFPVHRFFEKYIARYYYRIIYSRHDLIKRRILANKSWFFRSLSALALSFTFTPLKEDDGSVEGYTFYVFSKSRVEAKEIS